MNKLDKLHRKLEHLYMKALRSYAKRKIERGYHLEDKAIRLELKIRERLTKPTKETQPKKPPKEGNRT